MIDPYEALLLTIVTLASDSDDAIQRPTNRGNKLKRKAEYVREGQLDRPNGLKVYKKVELFLMHAAVDTRLTSLRESRMRVTKGQSSGATRNDTM